MRIRGRIAVVAGLILSLTIGPIASGPSLADDINKKKNAVDQSIDDMQETLSGTSKQLGAAYSQLRSAQARLTTAQTALRAARAKESAARRKDAELASRLAAAEKAQANAQQELAKGQAAIRETEQRTGQFAAQVYRNNGVSPQLSLVLGSSSPDDFASKSAMVDYVLQFQNGSLRALEQRKAANVTVQDRLNSVQQQVSVLRKQAAQSLQESKAASAAAAAQATKVKAALTAQAKVVATIRSRKAEEDKRLASLQSESNRLANVLKARAAQARARARSQQQQTSPDDTPIGPTGGLLNNPVPSAPVTSGFGWRMHPIYHYRRLHAGIDFGAPCGSPVYAAADGDVVRAGWAGGYGNQLVLDNGIINGQAISTTYNHLTRFVVEGGHVQRGQIVAYSGTTGSSTGCHLHFEVRVSGAPTDPAPYL